MSKSVFSPELQQPRRLIVSHASERSFAPMSRAILAKLGYGIVTPDEFDSLVEDPGYDRPDLRIVDERNLPEVPEDGGPPIPIIALTGRHGVTGVDPRIAGALRRPAGLHELYRLMQQVLEDTPRATTRVPTHINAVASRSGQEWSVSVLSLSENGCLIRSPMTLLLGSHIELHFKLPQTELMRFDAEAAYQLVPDFGLVFLSTSPSYREAITDYVVSNLAA